MEPGLYSGTPGRAAVAAAGAASSVKQELPRILCVDDEPSLLQGLAITLRRQFQVVTAPGGLEAAALLVTDHDFAIVMSDMRMPGMNGATFLARAREIAPDSVRVLLTGESDINSAIAAVNQGQIFHFLTKPCRPETLLASLDSALRQHLLITAERELLEKTLQGSVRALTDILALVQPAVFGQATLVKRLAGTIAGVLRVDPLWPLEMAALLFPVGHVLLPQKTADKLVQGFPLEGAEKMMADRAPAVARQILGNIPRLEPVTEIFEHYTRRFDGQGSQGADSVKGDKLPIGARILRVAIDFTQLDRRDQANETILKTLRGRTGAYDPNVLAALEQGLGSRATDRGTLSLRCRDLTSGMILAEDVFTAGGMLLAAQGHEITVGTLARLHNFSDSAGLREPILVIAR
jgi:response regulator RpfG family c-di-GMP phosphodiesterase